MSIAKKIDIQELSIPERILLAEELWDSIAENQDSLELTDAQAKILEQRLSTYKTSPEIGFSWEEIKSEMK